MFSIGDKVSIAFNKMPESEVARLEAAVSHSGIPGKRPEGLKSKVAQGRHQTAARTGTILEQRTGESGVSYLVNVDTENLPRGRQRVVIEDDLALIE